MHQIVEANGDWIETIVFRQNKTIPKNEIHIYSAGKKYIWNLSTHEIKECFPEESTVSDRPEK